MKVDFKPTSEILIDLGFGPDGPTQKFMQERAYQYMDKYVPMREGHLRYENIDMSDPRYIIYDQPYAHYQYIGMRRDGTHVVRNYTTAGTGPYWDQQMMSAEGKDLIKDIQDFINSGGGK